MGHSGELFMQLRQEETELQSGISFEHLLDAKKSNIANAVEAITTHIKDGNSDSLDGLILALKGKALFTDLEKALRPLVSSDYLDKLDKGYKKHSASIEQGATKTEYDYTVCNDIVWNDLSDKVKAIDADKKDRESFLKSLKEPLEIVDTDTGETHTIYPANKLQTEGFKITIQ